MSAGEPLKGRNIVVSTRYRFFVTFCGSGSIQADGDRAAHGRAGTAVKPGGIDEIGNYVCGVDRYGRFRGGRTLTRSDA
jgi:hypothetical protein